MAVILKRIFDVIYQYKLDNPYKIISIGLFGGEPLLISIDNIFIPFIAKN